MNLMVGIDKPKGMTSHDVVDRVRRITGVRKVGHAGTLDPNATGVLVIAITREATKKISTIVNTSKEYIATIEFGKTSDTDDIKGKITEVEVKNIPSEELITSALSAYVGEIWQIPPQYSAIKIDGKTAYKKARSGEAVELKARKVEVQEIEILGYEWPTLMCRIETGKGVYIRSIARDLGQDLKTGGLLRDLQRTRVGEYLLDDCLSLEEFEKEWKMSS